MLDHGYLNLPLAKRQGNIDAQLDRYKAEQASAAKSKARTASHQMKADRETAKALVASVSGEMVARLSDKTGKTVTAVRKWLASEAHWNPALIIRTLSN